MNQSASRVILLSGACSSIGLFPHLAFLLVLTLQGMPAPLGFLIPTYFASIFFSEYLFIKTVFKKTSFTDWLKSALHPFNPGYFFWAYVSEILLDGIFLILAIKFKWNPLHFFSLLLGCKFLSSPIQTYLSYHFLSKNAGYALAVATPLLLLCICENSSELFLYALILKGILCNGVAVARSQYTTEISLRDRSD